MGRSFTPSVDVTNISPHKSNRLTWPPRLIVVHSTEGHNRPGVDDLESLGEWFSNPAAQVSCHVATDAEGFSGRYVYDKDKAWHCAKYNSAALGIEQIGFSSQGSWPTAQLKETAKWIAYWSKAYGIPIRRAWVARGVVVRSGVARHSSLGSAGGNHDDPGKAYDLHRVLDYARWYKVNGWLP